MIPNGAYQVVGVDLAPRTSWTALPDNLRYVSLISLSPYITIWFLPTLSEREEPHLSDTLHVLHATLNWRSLDL